MLRDVFDVVTVPQDAPRYRKNSALVPLHKLFECRLVVVLRSSNQLSVILYPGFPTWFLGSRLTRPVFLWFWDARHGRLVTLFLAYSNVASAARHECFILLPQFRLATGNSLWNTQPMIIGDRLRALREEKKLSQGDIEKRTGLLRCYISRVENGHTVPAIETLEKLARALECPLYQLFYDGEEPPQLPNLPKRRSSDDIAWGSAGKEARYLNKLRRLLSKSDEEDRKLLLYMAQKMANR